MAQITITGKFTLDEANLITKLLVEGHRRRQRLIPKIKEAMTNEEWENKSGPSWDRWVSNNQEMLAIEAIQRELGSR